MSKTSPPIDQKKSTWVVSQNDVPVSVIPSATEEGARKALDVFVESYVEKTNLVSPYLKLARSDAANRLFDARGDFIDVRSPHQETITFRVNSVETMPIGNYASSETNDKKIGALIGAATALGIVKLYVDKFFDILNRGVTAIERNATATEKLTTVIHTERLPSGNQSAPFLEVQNRTVK